MLKEIIVPFEGFYETIAAQWIEEKTENTIKDHNKNPGEVPHLNQRL